MTLRTRPPHRSSLRYEVVSTPEAEVNLRCRLAEAISRDVTLGDDALAQPSDRYGKRDATEPIIARCRFDAVSLFLESTRSELERSSSGYAVGSRDPIELVPSPI